MGYVIDCKKCGTKCCLQVVGGTFSASGMSLERDGFSFVDAKNVDTEDEIVRCTECGATGPLENDDG